MSKRRIRHRKMKRSTENLPHDKIEATCEPVPEPKTKAIETILSWLFWAVLPATTWAVICWGTALYASDYHTSRLAANLIGLLVGTVVIGVFLTTGFEGFELNCFSVLLLILMLVLMQGRREAIQRQRHHMQQERKQHKSQRVLDPASLVALLPSNVATP